MAKQKQNANAGHDGGHDEQLDAAKQLIQARAYQIWEERGRPDGEAEAHWEVAEREVAETKPTD